MNDSDEEESDHEDFEVSRNFLEKQKEEYENDGNIEFLEVDNSYKRLFDCFYYKKLARSLARSTANMPTRLVFFSTTVSPWYLPR